jgi:hypothetical protein
MLSHPVKGREPKREIFLRTPHFLIKQDSSHSHSDVRNDNYLLRLGIIKLKE